MAIFAAAATTGSSSAARKSAAFDFERPTLIAGTVVSGQVVIVHDDDKMARGEACTTVYRSHRGRQGEKLVEFMCNPIKRAAPAGFLVRRVPLSANQERLAEYQFRGDTESHGVPMN
jgi:hypothetical protein